ncbi:MAG TPA: DUF5117 domain-containing protein [Verrucomicrobiales bacterium]|nr:DUF5117 domain-containing protein [Verrucomicrobiales bacterium]
MPRRHDSRVGFFNVSFVDFANNSDHEAETVRFITRWRLEKQNPAEKLSKPIKPIVFYVGRGTPDKWKSFVKAGIEAWQPAFEKAGFKNAILGRYAPDPREDPDWDAEDARISTIRWLPSNVENAFGPHVHDPRMYHNVQKLVRDWYFVQASASDERAQKLPMPDDLIGELIQFVVAHEVGHSLGFPHNMKASSSYTVEQLRDPEWTKENGTAPSIMDYARFNYVAQPGDGASLMPKIGPYDHFAVEWGYRRFSSDTDTEEELEKIVKRQVDEPMFRFGNRNPQQDSSQQTEDLGSDAVRATELGMKNLKRIAENLVEATCREGKNYDLLSNMYDQILGQWNREMGHVVNVVGGVKQINLFFGDADQRFFPQETEYQKQAVQFLIENALKTPTMFTSQDIVLRITAEGVAEKLLNAQRRVITGLVNSTRINRMIEHAEQASGEYYHPAGMLKDLSLGIFSELEESGGHPDLYRRNLQRSYLRHLGQTLEKSSVDSDLPALARSELIKIDSRLKTVEKQSPDALPQVHWKDLRARIEKALDKNKGQGD